VESYVARWQTRAYSNLAIAAVASPPSRSDSTSSRRPMIEAVLAQRAALMRLGQIEEILRGD
jgi:hypothetical protein